MPTRRGGSRSWRGSLEPSRRSAGLRQDLLADFLEAKRTQGASPTTLETYEIQIRKHFVVDLRPIPPGQSLVLVASALRTGVGVPRAWRLGGGCAARLGFRMSARMRGSALLPLTGVLFVVIIVAGFLVGGETPDADAPVREVVKYWTDHESANMIGSVLETFAAVSLLFFAATLRRTTKRWAEASILPAVAFAGGVVAAAGIGVDASIRFAAADVAGDVDPAVLQTFSAAWANFFLPMVIGIAALVLATSLAGWHSRTLPKWLAVIGILIFIAFFTPAGFVAFLVSAVWIIVLSVLLWRREAHAAGGPTSSTAA